MGNAMSADIGAAGGVRTRRPVMGGVGGGTAVADVDVGVERVTRMGFRVICAGSGGLGGGARLLVCEPPHAVNAEETLATIPTESIKFR
jgi:hypothetical protein